jgi:hypothetical protein
VVAADTCSVAPLTGVTLDFPRIVRSPADRAPAPDRVGPRLQKRPVGDGALADAGTSAGASTQGREATSGDPVRDGRLEQIPDARIALIRARLAGGRYASPAIVRELAIRLLASRELA